MEEQAISCISCGAGELTRENSPRIMGLDKWPVWEPGPQGFVCPMCGGGPVWAAEPRPAITMMAVMVGRIECVNTRIKSRLRNLQDRAIGVLERAQGHFT